MCVCIYLYVYIHIYVCVYIFICVYTHIEHVCIYIKTREFQKKLLHHFSKSGNKSNRHHIY